MYVPATQAHSMPRLRCNLVLLFTSQLAHPSNPHKAVLGRWSPASKLCPDVQDVRHQRRSIPVQMRYCNTRGQSTPSRRSLHARAVLYLRKSLPITKRCKRIYSPLTQMSTSLIRVYLVGIDQRWVPALDITNAMFIRVTLALEVVMSAMSQDLRSARIFATAYHCFS